MTVVFAVFVVVLAGVLTGVTGFGFSVLSVPLLLLVFDAHEVVVIALSLVPLTSGCSCSRRRCAARSASAPCGP